MKLLINMMFIATLLYSGEPKTFIEGKCLSEKFYLYCKVFEDTIQINGKHHDYKILSVIVMDGEHRFMIEERK